MRRRRLSREYTLQVLYQIDITRDDPAKACESFFGLHNEASKDEDVRVFAKTLVEGVSRNISEIDNKISGYATNWQFKRIGLIERNILRMAGFELLYLKDIPPKVTINEAVELAKKYSGAEAAKFVNGVLDKIKTESSK